MLRKSIFTSFLFVMLCFIFSACEKTVEIVKITTEFGDIYLYLYDETPNHKANFFKLAKEGFYNGTTFHRCIKNFVIQGGDPNSKDTDPTNDGNGGPAYTKAPDTYPDDETGKTYTINPEIKPSISHKYGSVAAARTGNPEMRSSGSQFYIVNNKKGTPHLDGKYTVYGEVVYGMDVVEKIADQPQDKSNNRPLKDIVMKVEIIKVKPSALMKKYNFKIPEHK
ncbi:MAG: peptidylprolyl isomerase [Bacteroidetes bacterium]|nr:peptidylprolyl isomerase [Bacteroidota bacterium]